MTANGRVGATAAVYTAAILGAGLPRAVVAAVFGFVVAPPGWSVPLGASSAGTEGALRPSQLAGLLLQGTALA